MAAWQRPGIHCSAITGVQTGRRSGRSTHSTPVAAVAKITAAAAAASREAVALGVVAAISPRVVLCRVSTA